MDMMKPKRLLYRGLLHLRARCAKAILAHHRTIVFDSPAPLFDGAWYAKAYPDVANAGYEPLEHYLWFGASEGRNPGPHFNTNEYSREYLSRFWRLDPLTHYVMIGRHRRAAASLKSKIVRYLRVRCAKAILLYHRAIVFDSPTPLFDRAWYAKTYPDVVRAGIDPLDHYLQAGAAEGRDPGPHFDTNDYAREHPVRAWGLDPLTHYVTIGRRRSSAAKSRWPTWRTHGPSPAAVEQAEKLGSVLAAVEPEFAALRATDLTELSIVAPPPTRRERAWLALYRSLPRPPRRLIIVDGLQEASPTLLRILEAVDAQGELPETLLLAADEAERPVPTWLPRGVLWRSFADLGEPLDENDRVQLVTTLVHSLQPASVLLVGSAAARLAWDRFGPALAQISGFYACVGEADEAAIDASGADQPPLLRAYVCQGFGPTRNSGVNRGLRAASSVNLRAPLEALATDPGFLAPQQPIRGHQ